MLGADRAALARVEALDCELTRLARSEALATGLVEGLAIAVAGLTVAGVLAVCVAASAAGALDRVLVATLALLAMASFEAVAPLPTAALRLQATLDSGRRLLALAGREPAVTDPAQAAPLPAGSGVAFEDVGIRLRRRRELGPERPRSADRSRAPRGARRQVGRRQEHDRRAARRAFSTPAKAASPSAAPTCARCASATCARGSRSTRKTLTCSRPPSARTCAWRDPRRATPRYKQALAQARIGAWVSSLPDGLDTFVGEEGESVSGGERRRIALARTFLAGAPVIVLDEPTGHLDPETAAALIDDVLRAADSRSVLLITHRPEGLDLVDEVVTLQRGRVVSVRPGRGLPTPA